MVQLYFAERNKEKVVEELGRLKEQLKEKRAEKKKLETLLAEKQRTAKEVSRSKHKLELHVQSEVGFYFALTSLVIDH